MKLQKIALLLLACVISLSAASTGRAQATTTSPGYQQMSPAERSTFVAAQARRIAREMSGSEYEFTPDFVGNIQRTLDRYVSRIGNGDAKRDVRVVFERGQAQAPTIIAAFRAHHVSPLIGLYIPWVESEYINISSPTPMGSLGMFQFIPTTGQHYGLSAEELLDVPKSANAAARYISDSIKQFKGDPMKEALALLAYNRGGQKVARDLKAVIDDQNKQCSICALTAASGRLDPTFQNESVYYVPRFFAGAIIGENPASFGLPSQPLSSH